MPQSAISVSMHKAGSSITDLILTDFYETLGYKIDRVANKVSASPLSEPEYFSDYEPQMDRQGVYYGMARNPGTHDLGFLKEFRVLVQMRDPRDCLTSAYFSYKGSHVPPKDPTKRAIHEERMRGVKELDITEFVLRTAPNYLMRCQKLEKIINEYPDTLLLAYEEMVLDTETWLKRISDWIGLPVDQNLRDKLGAKIDFSVTSEDAKRHKRQVTPGDHKRKLDENTIGQLNEILRPALEAFGYAE
ncbi:sulfotransferase domain-containing protein [Primorskyibacter aestuariivivens]|uniref:sulfotransferase domain-containing protein n=1 Tax=Primorskyibacter aestuariivivens TaxID=1888912 RepID=UPI0023017A38|nr:sulfotransferase domain-containing protein [Primorskyibacter aestuariivivens]MDA7429608.1 sulfotransferase domain-containing protein [Primorskyibacter aestuariivivens]